MQQLVGPIHNVLLSCQLGSICRNTHTHALQAKVTVYNSVKWQMAYGKCQASRITVWQTIYVSSNNIEPCLSACSTFARLVQFQSKPDLTHPTQSDSDADTDTGTNIEAEAEGAADPRYNGVRLAWVKSERGLQMVTFISIWSFWIILFTFMFKTYRRHRLRFSMGRRFGFAVDVGAGAATCKQRWPTWRASIDAFAFAALQLLLMQWQSCTATETFHA